MSNWFDFLFGTDSSDEEEDIPEQDDDLPQAPDIIPPEVEGFRELSDRINEHQTEGDPRFDDDEEENDE